MICPECKLTELLVNRVDPQGRISYVCWNPKCAMYKKAFTATGEEAVRFVVTEEEAKAMKAQ